MGTDPLRGLDRLGDPIGRQAIKVIPVIAGAAKDPTIGIIVGAVLVAAVVISFQYEFLPAAFALSTPAAGAAGAAGATTLTVAGQIALTAGFIGAGITTEDLSP